MVNHYQVSNHHFDEYFVAQPPPPGPKPFESNLEAAIEAAKLLDTVEVRLTGG